MTHTSCSYCQMNILMKSSLKDRQIHENIYANEYSNVTMALEHAAV